MTERLLEMNWKGCGRRRLWPVLLDYHSSCLEGWGKPRISNQDNQPPCWGSSPAPPEYGPKLPATTPHCHNSTSTGCYHV